MISVIGLDALISAIYKETERYRDAKATEKEEIRNALLRLRITINRVIIRIKLSITKNRFAPNEELRSAMEFGALEIDRVTAESWEILTEETYEKLQEVVEECIGVATSIKIAGLNSAEEIIERTKHLLNILQKLKNSIFGPVKGQEFSD